MLFYGLWQTEAQVNTELQELKSKKDKEEALKTQLIFWKNVFKQKCANQNVYAFSKVVQGHRTPLTVKELKSNVLLLVKGAFDIPTPDDDSHLLVGKQIEHKWLNESEATWYKGTDDIAVYAVELTKDYKAVNVVIRMWLVTIHNKRQPQFK
ncbi:LOW QUALITY PROTEIN: hypothetical protein MAR_027469, partial [Mya arenaria]